MLPKSKGVKKKRPKPKERCLGGPRLWWLSWMRKGGEQREEGEEKGVTEEGTQVRNQREPWRHIAKVFHRKHYL